MTLGAEGTVAARGTRVERVAGDECQDALGAGDTFAALLLLGLAGGRDLSDALARAAYSSR